MAAQCKVCLTESICHSLPCLVYPELMFLSYFSVFLISFQKLESEVDASCYTVNQSNIILTGKYLRALRYKCRALLSMGHSQDTDSIHWITVEFSGMCGKYQHKCMFPVVKISSDLPLLWRSLCALQPHAPAGRSPCSPSCHSRDTWRPAAAPPRRLLHHNTGLREKYRRQVRSVFRCELAMF